MGHMAKVYCKALHFSTKTFCDCSICLACPFLLTCEMCLTKHAVPITKHAVQMRIGFHFVTTLAHLQACLELVTAP